MYLPSYLFAFRQVPFFITSVAFIHILRNGLYLYIFLGQMRCFSRRSSVELLSFPVTQMNLFAKIAEMRNLSASLMKPHSPNSVFISDENPKDAINRRNEQGPKHLKFFLLVFFKRWGPSPRSPSPTMRSVPVGWLVLPVDSNGSHCPFYLRLRTVLPWSKNLSPAKTKGALTAVCTSTLKSL